MDSTPLRVGVAGLGTVGFAVVQEFFKHRSRLKESTGREIQLQRVASRSHKPEIDSFDVQFSEDLAELLQDDIDVVVELIGSKHPHEESNPDAAYQLVKEALLAEKSVITGNKALLANHGNELFRLAAENAVYLGFEAAVAGGLPIIQTLQNELAHQNVDALSGILNGTCNFILTEMAADDEFDTALKTAQELGYAESIPDVDIEGIDAAQKLTILVTVTFGAPISYENVYVEGITNITSTDIRYASALGYQVRHLGIFRRQDDTIEARVHPCVIAESHLLASVSGVDNGISIYGNGSTLKELTGEGAGGVATAQSVLLDLERLALQELPRSVEVSTSIKYSHISAVECKHFLSVTVDSGVEDSESIKSSLINDGVAVEMIKSMGSLESHADSTGEPLVVITGPVRESVVVLAVGNLRGKRSIHSVRRIRVFEPTSGMDV